MEKNLLLVKSERFGEIEADIYSNGSDMFMTINQLADCLGYADRSGVQKLVDRNDYLNKPEFSCWDNLSHESGAKKTRVFTEDGIYEITMLSGQPKAKEFRVWIRRILKALRSGKAKLVGMTEYQQMMAETRQRNARIQSARLLTKLAENYKGTTYEQVLNAHATKELTGKFLLPLPKLEAKTYSATEIGNMLGISAKKVGSLANQQNLKTDQYGQWFKDKSQYSSKEVNSFRYYESIVPILQEFISNRE